MQTEIIDITKLNIKYTDLFKNPKDIKIETLWKIFASQIFKGKQVSKVQYIEMQKSFFAGFAEMLKIMSDVATELTEDPRRA